MELMKLTPPEQDRFNLLVQAIDDGMAACLIVGAALREIKERKFYMSAGFKSFEDFVDNKWGWTKRYCNQLILDANAINSLPPSMRKLITSHKAAEELARIPETLRAATVRAATEGGKKATAKSLKKAAPPIPPRPKAKSGSKPPPRRAGGASSKAPPKLKGPIDATGLEVPAESLALWERGEEAQQLLTFVAAMKGRVERAKAEQDLLFVKVDFIDVLSKLDNIRDELKQAKPYAICPTCQGKLPKDCLLCKGRGFLSQFEWDQFVPEETKKMRTKK
jgi:hypothetical protein